MNFEGFATQFRKPVRVYSDVGSPIRTTYGASYDEKGRIILEEKGTENLYDYIQSFAESCDIHVLLKRFVNGETDVLSRAQGFYGDITQFPKTYAEMLNRVIEGEIFFKELPVDVRSKFGHSYSEFLASIGSQEFFDALGMTKPVEEVAEPIVVPDIVKEVEEPA
jgi:hypothetical protein